MPFFFFLISPDVIINPNAFPSWMTIGMMLEQIVSKGMCYNAKKQRFGSFEPCDYSDYKSVL